MINIREFTRVFSIFFALYFLSFFIVYKSGLNPQILQSEDFLATATVPFSLLKEQNYDLDEYYSLLVEYYPNPDSNLLTPYYLKEANGHYYSFFPTFTAILAIPVYIVPAYMKFDQSILGISLLSRLGGAFITALSVAIFWFVIKQKVNNKTAQILLLIAYALGTNTFSTSSQGLWQHGTSQLFNSLGLLSLITNRYPLAGLSFGLATIARPTNLLSLVFFGIYTLYTNYKNKKNINTFYYGVLALIPIIIQITIDTKIFGSLQNTGYGGLSHWTANIIEGFAGMWISPSKGLLITSPIIIFMLYGIFKSLKTPKENTLNIFIIAVILLHTIILGRWYNWFGGFSWGTRMASDVIPYMIYLIIPFVNADFFKRKIVRGVFILFLTVSIIYHFAGLIFFDGVWHTVYDGKKDNWLWSIQDSEPVFSIKRGLNKVGIGPNPIPLELITPAK